MTIKTGDIISTPARSDPVCLILQLNNKQIGIGVRSYCLYYPREQLIFETHLLDNEIFVVT